MYQEAVSENLAGRSDVKREEKQRRRRLTQLIVIILLLLLLLIALILAYVLSFMNKTESIGGIEPLFSLYGFDRPLAVTSDADDNIYVSDTGHDRLFIYDSEGNYIRRIGADKGPNRFYGVIGALVDPKTKNIFVSDWKQKVVSVFSQKGKLVKRFPNEPYDIRFGKLGFTPFGIASYKNNIYVTSYNGIYVFTKTGKYVKRIGVRGRGDGQFDFPIALAIDQKDGTMYVADQLNRRVVALSDKGVVKWSLGKPDKMGKSNSFFGLPRGLAIGPEGRIYVSDSFHHNIVVLSKKGEFLSTLGKRGVEDGKFNFPEGLVYRDDRMYIADRENDRIQAIRVTGFPKPDKKALRKYKSSFVEGKKAKASAK